MATGGHHNASISRFTQSEERAAGEIGLHAFVSQIMEENLLIILNVFQPIFIMTVYPIKMLTYFLTKKGRQKSVLDFVTQLYIWKQSPDNPFIR